VIYRECLPVGSNSRFDLTAHTAGATLVRYQRAPLPRNNEVREPVWSLSVEDPLPWRRLYSATSAVLTLVWSRKCAACSSASVTWRQNSSDSRPRVTLLRRKPATRRSAACRSASRHSPESDRSARLGTSPGGVPCYLASFEKMF